MTASFCHVQSYAKPTGHRSSLPERIFPDFFWKDARYRLLQTFASDENAQSLTDGAELTLFIWREFGESPKPPEAQGPSISQVIDDLRQSFK